MRELWWQLEGLQDQQWQHTSAQLSMMHNLQCTKDSQMKPPAHFNPMLSSKEKDGGKNEPLTKEQTTNLLKEFLNMATKGNYVEQKCRYVQNADGAWVMEEVSKE